MCYKTGDSAGGNLAAAVALKLSKEKSDLPPLLFQVLHYPAMQAIDMRLPSYVDLNESVPILTSNLMGVFYAYYFGLGECINSLYLNRKCCQIYIPWFSSSGASTHVKFEVNFPILTSNLMGVFLCILF